MTVLSCCSLPNGPQQTPFTDASENPISVYCYTSLPDCGPGPWALVMKSIYGSKELIYYSPFWTNKESLNPQAANDPYTHVNIKLPTYWASPITQGVCLWFPSSIMAYLQVPLTASSLYDVISGGSHMATNLDCDTGWKASLVSPPLSDCGTQGFNAQHLSGTKARIGAVAGDGNSNLGLCLAGGWTGADSDVQAGGSFTTDPDLNSLANAYLVFVKGSRLKDKNPQMTKRIIVILTNLSMVIISGGLM
ncbi:uncharacterized skeletal organic matrix protein 5-like [Nematostella vectensis]|uniref:uncharacterized skeletal organic matrix protein 5-like n=1 Tax=Nematostella vectensis TaxID=45351 RepID=UPI0020773F27|nr:uncharacterized skeletal organic matrix protein 5-like [Nematostella vectensis]